MYVAVLLLLMGKALLVKHVYLFVMPLSLRECLNLAHKDCLGISMMKRRLRSKLWWPGIEKNLGKVTIYLLTSCNTEERIAQNIYIHNLNKNYKNELQQY